MEAPLLEIKNLSVCFRTLDGMVQAVDDVSLSAYKKKTTCIVGESGCGKSVTSLAIMRLLDAGNSEINRGEILVNGEDLLKKSDEEMLAIRGCELSMVFQEPMTSLNPVYTIDWQLREVFTNHTSLSREQARRHCVEMLGKVGILEPEACMKKYPHELSGGMRQRVMIAMALALNPKLLIADEPTTALDVTIQAQILELMKKLRDDYETAIVLITHDMGVVADIADKVVVMYAGKIVEEADVIDLFYRPLHPYTEGLLNSIPPLYSEVERLTAIPGSVPLPAEMPAGCRFAPRCQYCQKRCLEEAPALLELENGRKTACFFAGELTLKGVSEQ